MSRSVAPAYARAGENLHNLPGICFFNEIWFFRPYRYSGNPSIRRHWLNLFPVLSYRTGGRTELLSGIHYREGDTVSAPERLPLHEYLHCSPVFTLFRIPEEESLPVREFSGTLRFQPLFLTVRHHQGPDGRMERHHYGRCRGPRAEPVQSVLLFPHGQRGVSALPRREWPAPAHHAIRAARQGFSRIAGRPGFRDFGRKR